MQGERMLSTGWDAFGMAFSRQRCGVLAFWGKGRGTCSGLERLSKWSPVPAHFSRQESREDLLIGLGLTSWQEEEREAGAAGGLHCRAAGGR